MSRTLTIPDTLYERLEAEARASGVSSIERYLEQRFSDDERQRRARAVQQADTVRESLAARYTEASDSVQMIREDRSR